MLTLTHQLPALFINPFGYLLPTGTAGQQTDRCKPYAVLTSIGIFIAVEITLHILKRCGKCFIALGLRQPIAGETFKLHRDSI